MDGELGHPDLLRRVVDGIAKLKRHADRGVEVLPPEVEVHITVGEGSVQVIERFVNEPSFDREVEAALRNKLVRAREDRMPVRRYFVKAGKKHPGLGQGEPAPGLPAQDRRRRPEPASAVPMQSDKRVFLVGRGPWHGDDQQVANDVIVCGDARRRSAAARRGCTASAAASSSRPSTRAKPSSSRARTGSGCGPPSSASGRVPVQPGDVIEFTDGAKTVLTVPLEEV